MKGAPLLRLWTIISMHSTITNEQMSYQPLATDTLSSNTPATRARQLVRIPPTTPTTTH